MPDFAVIGVLKMTTPRTERGILFMEPTIAYVVGDVWRTQLNDAKLIPKPNIPLTTKVTKKGMVRYGPKISLDEKKATEMAKGHEIKQNY